MIEAAGFVLAALVGVAAGMWLARPERTVVELEPYTFDYQVAEPGGWLEPWQDHRLVESCVVLPTEAVRLTAADDELRELELREPDRLDDLAEQIRARGLEQPLTVVVDSNGRVKLKDGNHRIICCLRVGVPRVPVIIKLSAGGIRRRGTNLSNVLEPMLRICVGRNR